MKPLYHGLCRLALASIIALPMVTIAKPSPANVTITPTIVVIEGRQRYADVNLINITDKPHTYAIGWRFLKMVGENGAYDNTDKSITDFDLTQNIVYTPKRVTIEPNGLQKIRLGLRLKGEPPAPGDYRAHLELKDVGTPDEVPVVEQPANLPPKTSPNQKAVTVGVKVNVGFTIPVVYRVGESTATPVLGTVTMALDKQGRPEVVIPVTKVGGETYGVLGGIKILYQDKVVGEVKNANIFPEVKSRIFKIPLNVKELRGGSLRVVYKHYDSTKDVTYAEKTIPVGQ